MTTSIKEVQVTQYETSDGTRFDDPEEAAKHEERAKIEDIVTSFYTYNMDVKSITDAIIEYRVAIFLALNQRGV